MDEEVCGAAALAQVRRWNGLFLDRARIHLTELTWRTRRLWRTEENSTPGLPNSNAH